MSIIILLWCLCVSSCFENSTCQQIMAVVKISIQSSTSIALWNEDDRQPWNKPLPNWHQSYITVIHILIGLFNSNPTIPVQRVALPASIAAVLCVRAKALLSVISGLERSWGAWVTIYITWRNVLSLTVVVLRLCTRPSAATTAMWKGDQDGEKPANDLLFDSTGMFHWCHEQPMASCVIVSHACELL